MRALARLRARLFSRGGERADSVSAIRALALMNVVLKAGLPFHRALAASRHIAKGAHARLIDRVFRGTLLGSHTSIEKATERETEGLPKEVAWVGGALRGYMLCGSEPDPGRRGEMLDRAFSTALDSCRQSLREAVSGLRVPVTTIFALGIVLPIVLATMIPLWGAAYNNGFAQGLGEPGAGGGEGIMAAMAVPILLFPAVSLLASTRVLSDGDLAPGRGGGSVPLMLAFFGGLSSSAFVLLFALDAEVDQISFALIVVPASMLAGRIIGKSRGDGEEDSMYEHPSELNAISARLASGEHFVRAVAMASDDRSEKSRIFWQAVGPAARRDGEGFGGEMAGLISETAKNDSRLAAQMLTQLARHLNDMDMVRSEVRFELRPIAQSVLVATIFLSPFVLGIAAGFQSIGAQDAPAVEGLFIVFIAEMALAGIWLVRRIGAAGGAIGGFSERPSFAVAVAALAFLASRAFSGAMFA